MPWTLSLWIITAFALLFFICSPCALVAGITATALVFLSWDFVRNWDTVIPLRTAFVRYLFVRRHFLRGWWINRQFQHDTCNPKSAQALALRKILETNSATHYARDYNLQSVRTPEEFIKIHPITRYTHFKAYCVRMMNGEEKVMSAENPVYFGLTSGTTGEPSKVPLLASTKVHYANTFIPTVLYHLQGVVPKINKLTQRMALVYNPIRLLDRTPCGTPMGPASCFLFEVGLCTSPAIALNIEDEPSARYVHLLFGLRKRDLALMDCLFASGVYMAFHDLEKQWKEFVSDIRNGTLKKDLLLDADERREIEAALQADPERAAELETEFKKGFTNSIATRIWPKLELITSITSGSFVHYAHLIKEKYINGVALFGPLYGCTEGGVFGLNLFPNADPSRYILIPSQVFLEFIPFENSTEDNPSTILLHEIQKEHAYELILTAMNGFYRYRMGDVVRVVDFYNNCPVIEVLHRTTHLLSIKNEKVSEIALHSALSMTLSSVSLKMEAIVDFTSCESVFLEELDADDKLSKSPYYTIFLETAGDCLSLKSHGAFAQALDSNLCEVHARYKYQRDKDGIDPLHVTFLQQGAFKQLRHFMLSTTTTSPVQLKIPRILRKPELVQFILSQRIQ